MVIGGQALLYYGEPRLTKDIDITVGLGPEEVSRIKDLSDDLRFKILVDSYESFALETNVIPCMDLETKIRIDFIFSYSEYEKLALKRVKKINIGDAEVCFASVEDIIIHKMIAGRARDIEDVKSIIIKNKSIDKDYIDNLLRQFDIYLSQPFSVSFEEIWRAVR